MESNKLNENTIVELTKEQLTEINGGGFWEDVGEFIGDRIYDGTANRLTGTLWYGSVRK
ncbi:hypothetical protein P4G82_20970 [Bacillus cereus]|nr:hypothetical protein [Bacillus cereus]